MELKKLILLKGKDNKHIIPVIGAGINGLLCSKALQENGYTPVLIDTSIDYNLSRFTGLHYLHDNCNIENLNKLYIENRIIRDENSRNFPHEDYAEKLGITVNNSVKSLHCYTIGYDIEQAYTILYNEFKSQMIEYMADSTDIKFLIKEFGIVVNTAPYNIVSDIVGVKTSEVMKFVEVSVETDKKKVRELIKDHITSNINSDNEVIYNVISNHSWYRYSRVNKKELVEYNKKETGCPLMKKVLTYTDSNGKGIPKICEYLDGYLINEGRYALWNRKILAHESYYSLLESINLIKNVIMRRECAV